MKVIRIQSPRIGISESGRTHLGGFLCSTSALVVSGAGSKVGLVWRVTSPLSLFSSSLPLSLPFPFPLSCLPSPFSFLSPLLLPSPSFPLPFLVPLPSLRIRAPLLQLGDLGESWGKLPQRGLGQSPSRNRFWCILALNSDIWWQQF